MLARGRAAIPTSKSSPAASAEIFRASFGHLAEATIRSIIASTDGISEPEKVLKGLAQLGIDEANMLANASHQPAPDAHVSAKVGPFKGARSAPSRARSTPRAGWTSRAATSRCST